ncbi:MAG: hypothetical protein IJK71_11410 [Clostridia bacterium]|nr:hypothetical protein [Clostridia bacterium]
MERTKKKNRILTFLKTKGFILLLDIIAVNLAYLIALHIRFFVNGHFVGRQGIYLELFWRIAPFYTIAAIPVFFCFRLYGGLQQYAGLNDLNRIIKANVVTLILQIVISIVVLALRPLEQNIHRMPFSYYVIGAVLQFIYMALIRFSKKIFMVEKAKIDSKKSNKVPALIIGSGDLGQKVRHHLDNNTLYRPVAIAGKDSGWMMDGVPVVSMDEIEEQIKEKEIQAVFIADKDLSKEQRDHIRQIAEGLEMDDFTGYMSNQVGFLPLTNLLEVIDMPIVVEVDGNEQKFDSAEECLSTLPGEYDVIKVQATKLVLKKREEDTSWMKVYQEQTGREVSYF